MLEKKSHNSLQYNNKNACAMAQHRAQHIREGTAQYTAQNLMVSLDYMLFKSSLTGEVPAGGAPHSRGRDTGERLLSSRHR